VVIAAIDTDGTDGPTGAAGAIVDAASVPTARGVNMNVSRSLRSHDTHTLLSAIGDVVMTGPTGTNVNDLKLALIGIPQVQP
jgi:glycerate-2-kinase